jgi:excisionase family DNA binding protein
MGSKQVQRDVGEPLMLTYREAAAKLGVSVSKLYKLMREGEIHNVSLGPRERRVPLSEVKAYADRIVSEQIGAGPGAAA